MVKSKKFKRGIITGALLVGLVGINSYTANAGTSREFWDMSIRALRQESRLTSRHKETNLQYSWVKVDKMTSIGKANVYFVGPTWTITNSTVIDNGVNTGMWHQQSYITSGSYIDTPIALAAANYNFNTTTGTISGWVDYE